MKRNCIRCSGNKEFEVPEYTLDQKRFLVDLKLKQQTLEVIEEVTDMHDIEIVVAKFIVNHINIPYGSCNRCHFDNLDEEYVSCPKCKGLNFNWRIDHNHAV